MKTTEKQNVRGQFIVETPLSAVALILLELDVSLIQEIHIKEPREEQVQTADREKQSVLIQT